VIPLRFQSHCVFCGDDVDIRRPGVYQLTRGWVKNRKQGGGNAVAMPERLHVWACTTCIDSRLHASNGQTQFDLSL
jgi:hypothetical protein